MAGNQAPADGKDNGKKPEKDSRRDILIVVASLATLIILASFAIFHYTDSKDAASVLGVIVPGITTIGAAAFGINLGKAAGDAGKKAAEEKLEKTKETAKGKADDMQTKLTSLESAFASTADTVKRFPSPGGKSLYTLASDETPGFDVSFDPSNLVSVQSAIDNIESDIKELKTL